MKQRFSLFLLLFFLFAACPGPGPEEGPVAPGSGRLDYPRNVEAHLAGDAVSISWDLVANAKYYQLYRKTGNGVFTLLTENLITETYWFDNNFPYDTSLTYALKSERAGIYSILSEPSNSVTIASGSFTVPGVEASLFGHNDRIEVIWTPPENAESYVLYRYYSNNDEPEIRLPLDHNTYIDSKDLPGGPLEEIPYFYLITWVDGDGREMGLEGDMVPGLMGANVDYYEPNENLEQVLPEEGDLFSTDQPPYIYYLTDNKDNIHMDRDWYKYEIQVTDPPQETLTVLLTQPENSPFLEGSHRLLFLRFYYEGVYYTPQKLQAPEATCLFDNLGPLTPGEMITLYFEIYPVVEDMAPGLITSYTLRVSDELM